MDNGDRIDTIVIATSKAFVLVPYDWLLMKIAISGVDSRVVTWVREFLLGHTRRVRIGGQISEEFRVTPGIPHGSVLAPLLLRRWLCNI
jgi:hypothetical protein